MLKIALHVASPCGWQSGRTGYPNVGTKRSTTPTTRNMICTQAVMLAVVSLVKEPIVDWNTAVAVTSIGVRLLVGTQSVAVRVIETDDVAVPATPFASV